MNWYGFQSVQKVLTAHHWVWSGPEVMVTFVKLNCTEISMTDSCENIWPVNRTSEKNSWNWVPGSFSCYKYKFWNILFLFPLFIRLAQSSWLFMEDKLRQIYKGFKLSNAKAQQLRESVNLMKMNERGFQEIVVFSTHSKTPSDTSQTTAESFLL